MSTATAANLPVITDADYLDPAFDRDFFLLNQRLLSLNEKYDVADESGEPILFVERPRFFFRRLLALVAVCDKFSWRWLSLVVTVTYGSLPQGD